MYLKQLLEKYPNSLKISCYLELKDVGFKCKKNSKSIRIITSLGILSKFNWKNVYIELFALQ